MSGLEILAAIYAIDLSIRLGTAAFRSEWLRDFFSPEPPADRWGLDDYSGQNS